ncbi:MAG: glycosyltransferase [Eubacteriales bacterium]|nr:glycosyltransferase [Eubacteriales bacterium]
MKVLQVNTVYPSGSTGKMIQEIHKALLASGHSSVIVYGRGETSSAEEAVRLCPNFYGQMQSMLSRITGLRYGGCRLSTNRLIRMIRQENPDLVHLHSINDHFVNIYQLISWLKEQRIPTVITLHAEFFYTANCSHAMDCGKWKNGCGHCPRAAEAARTWFLDRTAESWKRMYNSFQGMEQNCVLVPVSPWVEERALQSPILNRIPMQTILNGINTDTFFMRQVKDPKKKTVFHATAYFSDQKDHPKGGWHVLQLAERMTDVQFVVAGRYKEGMRVPENVMLLGNVSEQEKLAEFYASADLTLLTSKRETFSMPCAESLCCGTPVVGYRAGGPECIALKEYSEFVEYGNTELLERCVRKWLMKNDIQKTDLAHRAKLRFSGDRMTGEYLALYSQMLN